MSFGALDWVFKHSHTKGSERLVMIALAHALNVHEGDDFESCWPGKASIAGNAGLSERQVQRCIQALTATGELTSEPHPAWSGRPDRRPNQYRFPLMERGDSLSPRVERGDREGTNGETNTTERGDTVVSLTKREPKEEPKGDSGLFEPEPSRAVDETLAKELDARFEEIWKNYPRKVDKKESFAAFKARVKQGVPSEELAAAVLTYASQRKDEDPKFTLLGKTFFGPNEKWKRYLPGEDSQAEDDGRYFDEDGDEVSESTFNAQNLDRLHRSPEMRKWA